MRRHVTLAAAVSALAAAAPAGAEVPAGNLLANPGGEAAPGAPNTELVAPPGWTTESSFSAVQYADSTGFPTPAQSASWAGGANFFAGGPDTMLSAASQTIDVTAAAAEIDAGRVTLTLSALIGGYQTQADNATVTASALSAGGAALSRTTLPAVTPADRNQLTTLLARAATGAVPAGTRRISVRIEASRLEGSYNDGYVDNVSLSLSAAAPPVFHKTVVVSEVSGTIRVRRPGSRTFVDLDAATGIPLGSTVDAKRGVVALASVPRAGGAPQTAQFYDGIFVVRQPGAITELTLSEALARCPRGAAAAAKPKKRRLWGSGKGAFRTRGQYSAATIRGTKWLVEDSCAGTLTRVTEGRVTVRDLVRSKTITLRKGQRYVARPR